MTGWLGYYARVAGDPVPVFQSNAPFRYTCMSEALADAPHLTFGEQGERQDMQRLGIVTRDDADGRALASSPSISLGSR
jgi:hypothetical protein